MLDWLSVSALTGQVLARFPDASASGALRHVINQFDTGIVQFPISSAPLDWENASRPGACAFIALKDNLPLWGGYVTSLPRSIGDVIALSLVSGEGYFDRRLVKDSTYAGISQVLIASDLVTKFASATGAKLGVPIRVAAGASTQLRDRTYLTNDFATLYARLQQLAGVLGGIEWTVDWEWSDSTHITPVFRVSDRLGRSPNPGLKPAARFFTRPGGGNISTFDSLIDYTIGNGANDVTAYSAGQGDSTPVSAPAIAALNGRPTFELAYQPDSSISDVATLNAYAQQQVGLLKDGTVSIAFTAELTEAPALNDVWAMGDDVSYDIRHPSVPNGLVGIARAAGYELTDNTITPILVYPALSAS